MRIILIALILFVAAPHAAAQFATPEEVVRAIEDGFNRQDLQRVARTVHPEELDELKRFFVELEELAQAEGEPLHILSEGDSFAAMPREEVYEWLLTMILVGIWEEGRTLYTNYNYLGHVGEGDLLHVVVRVHTRLLDTEVGELETSQVEIITMRQYEGRWFAMLTADVQSVLQALRSFLIGE